MLERQTLAGGAAAAVALAAAALAPAAGAHFERNVTFPDPAPDASVSPPAGGAVPAYRSRGRTIVVCKRDSLARARRGGARGALLRRNARLLARCRHRDLQAAVATARNGTRILVLPGLYREWPSRRQPTFDERCSEYREVGPEQGPGEDPQALTYRYQAACPNDQNLVAVIGRDPETGRCLRCNLQIEGTGRRPQDVVVDAGRAAGDEGKDVGIRGDRADGIQVRNMRFTRAGEHGVYFIETDGYLIRHVIGDTAGNYGFLTFASDHGVTDGCEAYANNNAGVYPGGAPDTAPRANQVIRHCRVHDNVLGYSGTMGNSTLVEDNDFFRNTVGINTDSFLAAGHPGYPEDHATFRRNRIYSNNTNPYVSGSNLRPSFPFPVGTGINITGGNDNLIEGNWIYDNWRRGTMLTTVPGFVSEPPQPHPDPTSHRNAYRSNHMGVAPNGARMPNGVDFWWDEAGTGNCWEDNGEVRTDPPSLDRCPGRPAGVPGVGNPQKQAVLASCATWPEETDARCDWFETPPPPGGTGGAHPARRELVPLCPPLGPLACATQAPRPGRSVNARERCADWNAASEASRRGTVETMRQRLAADVQYAGARVVPAPAAAAHLAAVCAQPVASGFSVWEVFTVHSTWYAAGRAR
ncbi:MAG TPA: right-handed parallel beta-helix repeat-containing protein [Thermoleophilaceae bacterium]